MLIGELHVALCAGLELAGGMAPETILPNGYNGKRADAVFVNERVIVEVKSLCKDRVGAKELQDDINSIVIESAKIGGPVIFGTVSIDVDTLPPETARQIISVYGRRIQRELNDANRQIRATAEALDWDSAYGVVAFITPAAFKTHPGVIGRAAWDLLKRTDQAPFVNAMMTFTAPVEEQGNRGSLIVIPHPRVEGHSQPELFERIAEAWAGYYARQCGTILLGRQQFEVDHFDTLFMAPKNRS